MPALVEPELFAVYPSATGGVAALQGLTLTVDEGEICVVLGPDGSGKTTLMRILAGLARAFGRLGGRSDRLDLTLASRRRLARYRGRVLGYADQHYWRGARRRGSRRGLVGVPLGLARLPDASGATAPVASRAGRSSRPSRC